MSESFADHIEAIRKLSRDGGALTAFAPTATIQNPDWFVEFFLEGERHHRPKKNEEAYIKS